MADLVMRLLDWDRVADKRTREELCEAAREIKRLQRKCYGYRRFAAEVARYAHPDNENLTTADALKLVDQIVADAIANKIDIPLPAKQAAEAAEGSE